MKNSIELTKFFLVDDGGIINTCLATTRQKAKLIFDSMGLQGDYVYTIEDMKIESDLNALENQTYEG